MLISYKTFIPIKKDSNKEICLPKKTNIINTHTYTDRSHNDRWLSVETELFFWALENFGTNFDLIAGKFTNRNREQIKNKYLKECLSNHNILFAALTNSSDSNVYHNNNNS